MESLGVLLTHPMNPYIVEELDKRFNLFRLWEAPPELRRGFVLDHAGSIRALVCRADADADCIDILPNLEIVAIHGVGVDKIDLGKCREKGIRITNIPDVPTDDVADLAIGLAIATMRRIVSADRYVCDGKWKSHGDYKLTTKFGGKTVGIAGLGRIGSAIAKRAEAFGCPIVYSSRTQKPDVNYTYCPNILDLAANCQVLAVACPLTEETCHIIDREVLDALGPKGVLVNIARGPIVDERELVSALVEGRLGGAGLDVFESEPHVPEELLGLENVVLVPHVGSRTTETRKVMADLIVANLEAHALNKPLLTPVV